MDTGGHLHCFSMTGVQLSGSCPHLLYRLHLFGSAIGRVAANFKPAWLHCLRDLPGEFDLQQAILERCSLDLNVIFEVELTFEGARRNALMQVVMIRRLSTFGLALAAGDRQPVLPCRDGDLVGREACESER